MQFDILGGITHIEAIAISGSIRDLPQLREQFGPGRWKKLKDRSYPIAYWCYQESGVTLVRSAWRRQAQDED